MANPPNQKSVESRVQIKEAKIAAVVDQYRVVINAGYADGVKVGQRFLIYKIGDEVTDPDTKESLGRLEVVKGTGEAIHTQEKMATLQTTEKHEIQRRAGMWHALIQPMEISKEPKAFIDPEVGDIARPIG